MHSSTYLIFFYLLQADRVGSFLKAARHGNLEKVIDYLNNGIDVNISNNVSILSLVCQKLHSSDQTFKQTGLNALHLASKEGFSKIVEELLTRKANLDAPTKVSKITQHT